jgi:hypothetical protein
MCQRRRNKGGDRLQQGRERGSSREGGEARVGEGKEGPLRGGEARAGGRKAGWEALTFVVFLQL